MIKLDAKWQGIKPTLTTISKVSNGYTVALFATLSECDSSGNIGIGDTFVFATGKEAVEFVTRCLGDD